MSNVEIPHGTMYNPTLQHHLPKNLHYTTSTDTDEESDMDMSNSSTKPFYHSFAAKITFGWIVGMALFNWMGFFIVLRLKNQNNQQRVPPVVDPSISLNEKAYPSPSPSSSFVAEQPPTPFESPSTTSPVPDRIPPPLHRRPCDSRQDKTFLSSQSAHDSNGDLRIALPKYAQEGDLLLLFLSRTDDVLPVEMDGWTVGASCFKEHNGQQQCWTTNDCLSYSEKYYTENIQVGPFDYEDGTMSSYRYCHEFPKGHSGRDLATVVFYRFVTRRTPRIFRWDLVGDYPAWGILTVVPQQEDNIFHRRSPVVVRSTMGASCDRSAASQFPSVYGKAGDLLFLHMSFDDRAEPQDFQAPAGMERVDWTNGQDEAGFLYAQRLVETGLTQEYETIGAGGSNCKDALLSVVIQGQGNQTHSVLTGDDPCA